MIRQFTRSPGFGRSVGVLLAAAVVGCGTGGPVRYDLAGEVRFHGRPVPAGLIFFDPDVSQGNDGPPGFATIRDGHYDTRANGKGVIGGPHRVRIHAFDGQPGAELPMGKMLCPEYVAAVDLPRGPSTRDFDIPAGPGPGAPAGAAGNAKK